MKFVLNKQRARVYKGDLTIKIFNFMLISKIKIWVMFISPIFGHPQLLLISVFLMISSDISFILLQFLASKCKFNFNNIASNLSNTYFRIVIKYQYLSFFKSNGEMYKSKGHILPSLRRRFCWFVHIWRIFFHILSTLLQFSWKNHFCFSRLRKYL